MKEFESTTYAARILLINDKPEEIKPLLNTFRSAQFNICIAFDGIQGYGRAVATIPDLILLDISFGQFNEMAIFRLLKADHVTTHIPVIFLTSPKALDEKVAALREGAIDYISKPVEPVEAVARIRAHLRIPVVRTARNDEFEPPSRDDDIRIRVMSKEQ
jgi:DNA-binding response OmpR family regulator